MLLKTLHKKNGVIMGNLMAHIVIRRPPNPLPQKKNPHIRITFAAIKGDGAAYIGGLAHPWKKWEGREFIFFFFKTAQCASLPSASSRPPISTAPSARASFIPAGGFSNHGEQTAKRSEVRGRKKRKSGEEEAAGRSLIDSSISVLPPSACF